MWWALWVLGCGGDDGEVREPPCEPPVFRGQPRWFAAAGAEGIRFLQVELDRPATLAVRDGPDHQWVGDNTREAHEVAVVGLSEGAHELVVQATGDDGCVVQSAAFVTEVVHAQGIIVDVLALDHAAMGDAWTVLNASVFGGDRSVLVVVDAEGRVVWTAEPARPPRELRVSPDWTFVGTSNGRVVEVDLAGEELSVIEPEAGPLHHDAVPLPDGTWWTLVDQTVTVDAYPLSAQELDQLAPASLRDQIVVRMDGEGRTLQARAMSEVLDTRRVSYNSFRETREGLDWTHGNGLSDDGEGGVWVSLRHQDAVVHLDPDLELIGILGDPGGWVPPWDALRLRADQGFAWFYQPHAPEVLPDGSLVLFDNHKFGGTPYDPPDPEEPTWSRAVAYRVDDGRVEQVWERSETATGRLFSGSVGDVDVDAEGRIVADFGWVTEEGGRLPSELGYGDVVARIVGWAPDGSLGLDFRVAALSGMHPGGLYVYRMERFPPVAHLIPWEAPASAIPLTTVSR